MKICTWIVWILIAVAIILMIIAGVSLLFGFQIWGINLISFFHAANSFLLLSIALYLINGKCCISEKCKE
jgi:hypothetical protein